MTHHNINTVTNVPTTKEKIKIDLTFYIYVHGSVNRESNLIIVFQHDATYSFYCSSVGSSTCFGF